MPQALWHHNRVWQITDGVRRLSDLPEPEARTALLTCCASAEWTERMLSQRPFKDRDEVFAAAERFWQQLGAPAPGEWQAVKQRLEAMLQL